MTSEYCRPLEPPTDVVQCLEVPESSVMLGHLERRKRQKFCTALLKGNHEMSHWGRDTTKQRTKLRPIKSKTLHGKQSPIHMSTTHSLVIQNPFSLQMLISSNRPLHSESAGHATTQCTFHTQPIRCKQKGHIKTQMQYVNKMHQLSNYTQALKTHIKSELTNKCQNIESKSCCAFSYPEFIITSLSRNRSSVHGNRRCKALDDTEQLSWNVVTASWKDSCLTDANKIRLQVTFAKTKAVMKA